MGKAKEFICQKPQLGLTWPRYCSLMETGQIALNGCYLLAQDSWTLEPLAQHS